MIGQTLSHYRVLEEISRGGMGIVYRARDLKLKREVALKVLPAELVADPERKRRFLQEGQAAAALDHPHIAVIHEIDDVDGVSFMSMELIRGEPLRDVLARERLSVSRSLALATEIAEGLSRAHELGIVHRDLKPANVIVTEQGHVKIIDFGLAKLLEPLLQESSEDETAIRDGTDPGLVMGTVSYMSPEQARGGDVDARSDIFSFGVVLYEMLTGRRPFSGVNAAETLSAILKDPPPKLPALELEDAVETHDELQQILDGCLAKNAADRYPNMREVGLELNDARRRLESGGMHPATRTGAFRWSSFATGAIDLVSALVGWILLSERPDTVPRIEGTTQLTHDAGLEVYPAVSPDGDMLAFAAGPVGKMHVYVQQLNGGRRLAITEEPGTYVWPLWSPDGATIAYQRHGGGSLREIYVVPALGGVARRVYEGSSNEIVGFTWSPNGTKIAIAEGDSLVAISLEDGSRRVLAAIPETARGAFPITWSPDGRRIAFSLGNPGYVARVGPMANVSPSSIHVVALDGSPSVAVTEETVQNQIPLWTPDGETLMFMSDRGGNRDVYQVRLGASGEPTTEPQRLTTGAGLHTMSLSGDGTRLVYSTLDLRQNIWSLPMSGLTPMSIDSAEPVTDGSQVIEGMDVSPDGQWLLFDSNRSGNQDIYKRRLDGGDPIQLTADPANDFGAAFSPDGTQIAFYSLRAGNDVYVMSAEGDATRLLAEDGVFPDWSPDGSEVVFFFDGIHVVPSDGSAPPRQLVPGTMPKWSPDGRWIAFVNDRTRIAIVSPTDESERTLVTLNGVESGFPGWSLDSRTVYYKTQRADGTSSLWSVPVTGGEPTLLVRFDDPAKRSVRREWTHDGERFYFTLAEQEADIWLMELSRE